jgi:hypothetical protein
MLACAAALFAWALLVQPAAAQAVDPAGAAPAPPTSEPVTAWVRLYLHDILKFDPASGFTADVYVGIGCQHACGDIGLIVDNGRANAREVLLDAPNRKGYRMELALTDQTDLHRYPFDVQTLSVVFLSARPADEFRFAVDQANTRVGDIRLQGWEIDPAWRAETMVQPFDEFTGQPRPTYRFSIDVQRPFLAGFFKVILPGLAILLIGSLGLVVGPDERMKRFDLFNAAFLGTVLFQLSLLSSLPPLSYLTFADRFLLINLLSIILGVVSSVIMILAFRSGKKARAWAVHEWSMIVMPLVWLMSQSVNVLTSHVFDLDDARLWGVVAAEAAVSVTILIWYSRRMHLTQRFRSMYARTLEQTRAPHQALSQTLDIFASEPPLNGLTRNQLDFLGELFAPLPDPTIVADILQDAMRTHDANVLKDRAALERFVAYVSGQRAPAGPPERFHTQTAA